MATKIVDLGSVVGPKGEPGEKGDPGEKGAPAAAYGTCATTAATATKVVTVDGEFTLEPGTLVAVKFTYSNSATSPMLDVNSTGSKYIKKFGTTAADTYMWATGAVKLFVYNGTYWVMVDGTTATTTYYGLTKLSDSVSNSSTALAATANAVRQAYSLASAALQKSGGTMTGALYAKDDTDYTTANVRNIKFADTDLEAGTSELTSGQVALIYE